VALGTSNVVLLVEEAGGPRRSQLDGLAARAFMVMRDLEEELSKFEPESEVSLLNYLGAESPMTVSPELFHLLQASRLYWEKTRGAFDPTLAHLTAAWGFDDQRGRVPSDEEIEVLLAQAGMDGVLLDETDQTVLLARPGMALDLGGIGKGYIIDQAVRVLREAGVESGAFLSGRSSLVFWGRPAADERWRVGVSDPRDADRVCFEFEVEGGAVSSSSASERSFELNGAIYGHVLDPRTGRPVHHRGLGVTVWTPDAMVGDVASTALFVLGSVEGQEILDDLAPISAVFIDRDPDRADAVLPTLVTRGRTGLLMVE
jgi:thiamine biosynthesis lipoprotein